jgi:hypothetical protein
MDKKVWLVMTYDGKIAQKCKSSQKAHAIVMKDYEENKHKKDFNSLRVSYTYERFLK